MCAGGWRRQRGIPQRSCASTGIHGVGVFAYGEGMGSEGWGVRRAQALESALILHSEPGQAMDPTSSQYFHRYIQEIEFSGFCESLFSLLYSVRQRKKCLGPGH